MKDALARPKEGRAGGLGGYYMQAKVCATCGQSTRKSYHETCKRVDGKLLVVDK
jgi:hypothetical protein